MRTSDFDYRLPPELIAQTPIEPRDSSRLLVLDRASGAIQHRRFTDILEYLRPGDVMVFKLPTDNKTDYIKRIIGLPGDTVQLKNSVLYINNKAVKRERVEDFIERAGPNSYSRTPRYLETLPGGKRHYVLEVTENTLYDNTPVYKVPEGHYFAMGDNRDKSRDSRFLDDVGYIPKVNLVGRAEFLFLSVDGAVWKFWEWAISLRFERFFQAIE